MNTFLYNMTNEEIIEYVAGNEWHHNINLIDDLADRLEECLAVIERQQRIIDSRCTNPIFDKDGGEK